MNNEIATTTTKDIAPMVLVQQLMQRPDFTTDMLRDMLSMVREQEERAAKRLFKAAFSRCQAKVTKAEKDETNPLFRSRYASIEAMYDAVWPSAMHEGFCWTVSALPRAPEGWDNGMLWFQGKLSLDIHTETVELPVSVSALTPEGPKGGRPAMTATQAIGALTTYMRKYLLGLMFGVVTSDDVANDRDGNNIDYNPPRKPPLRTSREPPVTIPDENEPAPPPIRTTNGTRTLKQVGAELAVAFAQVQSIGGLADIEARDEMTRLVNDYANTDTAKDVLKARDAARARLAVLFEDDGSPGPKTGEITDADRLMSG